MPPSPPSIRHQRSEGPDVQAPSQWGTAGTEGSSPTLRVRTVDLVPPGLLGTSPAARLTGGRTDEHPYMTPELTYYLHGAQVYPDFLEAGEASCRVVLPTLAVVTPAPIVGTFGWVV